AIRRALAETADEPGKRATLLDADIEVSLAVGDLTAARASAAELAAIAERLEAGHLRAAAAKADGCLLLAEGRAGECLAPLRRAWAVWRQPGAPHEAARVRVLLGQAYQELGDGQTAAMEFDAAHWVFEQLQASPDIAQVESLTALPEKQHPGGLTSREVEVLGLIAAGSTNKEIAATLVISEHTVARHVQNMFGKLGCPSRAALAAFAVEQGLVPKANG
ncbi:MAG TPA: LuxR C-terminal-related transcriptional regulator, partial [Gemmatimonadales bacterium]|nr:LuxR C-terminal-related transcriptional regulator [Gemmatimonadales bacterium]